MTGRSDRPGERLVTLVDGRQVSSWSEDFRHECEARAILAMPTLRARQAHLFGEFEHVKRNGAWISVQRVRGIQQARGKAEVERLKATMTAIWSAKRRGAA